MVKRCIHCIKRAFTVLNVYSRKTGFLLKTRKIIKEVEKKCILFLNIKKNQNLNN